MIARYSLGPRDLLEVAWCLLLIAGPTNRDDAIGVVGVIVLRAQCEWRPMIEDDFAEDHACSAVETASLLPQHDFGAQEVWERASFASVEGALAIHSEPFHVA
jgi:hypothetical protein